MLDLAPLYGGFEKFRCESVLIYLSYPGLISPRQVLDSCSIDSVTLKIHFRRGFVLKKQRFTHVCDAVENYIVDAGKSVHLGVRISDLHEINVKNVPEEELGFNRDQETGIWCMKERCSSSSSFVLEDQQSLVETIRDHNDAVLHLFIRKHPESDSDPAKKVFTQRRVGSNLELLMAATDVIRLESVVYTPDFTVPPVILDLIETVLAGLRKRKPMNRSPSIMHEYYGMPDSSSNSYCAIFTPVDENALDPHDKFIMPRDKASREVAAYLLDHPRYGDRSEFPDETGFAGVPPTAMVRCLHGAFNPRGDLEWKTGSLRKIIRHDYRVQSHDFPAEEVHKICVLDIRFANTSRLRGSIRAKLESGGKIRLCPSFNWDCFSDHFGAVRLEWKEWSQAQKPFSREIVEYVERLDAERDMQFLKDYCGWEMGSDTALMLKICTMLLKEAVKKGLTAYQISNLMTSCDSEDENRTVLEKMMRDAERLDDDELNDDDDGEPDFLHKLSHVMKLRLNEL